jgi:hypothetical protein
MLGKSKRTIQESGLSNTNHVEKFHDPMFLGKLRHCVAGHPAANRGGPEQSDTRVANDSHDQGRLKPCAIG